VRPQRILVDTSIFIGLENARLDAARFADFEFGVSVITLGELRLGVLQASGQDITARRLSTYQLAQQFDPLVIDEAVTDEWALLVSRLRVAKRRVPINDSWIAATALAHGIPIFTQDDDYDSIPGLDIIRP
jgi:predicted nucleic acid-binding protein